MRYVVLPVMLLVVIVGVIEWAAESTSKVVPASLQLEEGARMPADDLPLAELAVATRESVWVEELNPTVEQPLLSLLEAFLLENPGSPLGLLPPDEAAKYLATRENLIVWVASVDELDDIDLDAVEWTDDLQHLWGICRQEQALYSFVLRHSAREFARWSGREQSISLEAELQSVRQFMDRNLGNDSEIWSLVSDYSDEVANKLRGEGAKAKDTDYEPSMWKLYSSLVNAGAPSFGAVIDTLRTNTK